VEAFALAAYTASCRRLYDTITVPRRVFETAAVSPRVYLLTELAGACLRHNDVSYGCEQTETEAFDSALDAVVVAVGTPRKGSACSSSFGRIH